LLVLLLPLFKLQVCSFPMFCLFIILKIFIWSGNDKFYIQFLCQLQKYEKNEFESTINNLVFRPIQWTQLQNGV
jgi:hypothetical protein